MFNITSCGQNIHCINMMQMNKQLIYWFVCYQVQKHFQRHSTTMKYDAFHRVMYELHDGIYIGQQLSTKKAIQIIHITYRGYLQETSSIYMYLFSTDIELTKKFVLCNINWYATFSQNSLPGFQNIMKQLYFCINFATIVSSRSPMYNLLVNIIYDHSI